MHTTSLPLSKISLLSLAIPPLLLGRPWRRRRAPAAPPLLITLDPSLNFWRPGEFCHYRTTPVRLSTQRRAISDATWAASHTTPLPLLSPLFLSRPRPLSLSKISRPPLLTLMPNRQPTRHRCHRTAILRAWIHLPVDARSCTQHRHRPAQDAVVGPVHHRRRDGRVRFCPAVSELLSPSSSVSVSRCWSTNDVVAAVTPRTRRCRCQS